MKIKVKKILNSMVKRKVNKKRKDVVDFFYLLKIFSYSFISYDILFKLF